MIACVPLLLRYSHSQTIYDCLENYYLCRTKINVRKSEQNAKTASCVLFKLITQILEKTLCFYHA